MPRSAALPCLHTQRGSNFLCHDIAVNQVWGRLCRFAGKHHSAIRGRKITFFFSAVSFSPPVFHTPDNKQPETSFALAGALPDNLPDLRDTGT